MMTGRKLHCCLAAGAILSLVLSPVLTIVSVPRPVRAASQQYTDLAYEHKVPGQIIFRQGGLTVRERQISEAGLTLHYPYVTVEGDSHVTARINHYFKAQAERSQEAYTRANRPYTEGRGEMLTSSVDYLVDYADQEFLGFRCYGMDYYERAAHPSSWERGVVFDRATGRRVTWQEVLQKRGRKPYTLELVNEALWASPYGKEHSFFEDFTGLARLPENFYLDRNGKIHFIFQQYEIAPYAAGIIDLPME